MLWLTTTFNMLTFSLCNTSQLACEHVTIKDAMLHAHVSLLIGVGIELQCIFGTNQNASVALSNTERWN